MGLMTCPSSPVLVKDMSERSEFFAMNLNSEETEVASRAKTQGSKV